MRIRELKEEFPWTTEQSKSRSKGLHLTDVIHQMDKTLMETADREIDDEARMQFEKGWLWEVALSRAFGEKAAVRAGEVSLDGVAGSPDGVGYDDREELVVDEYKCTTYSADKRPTDMWRWMMQVKGYCKMVGATKCVFRVLHLSFVPVYKVWVLVFTQEELDENWQSVLAQAKVMRGDEL